MERTLTMTIREDDGTENVTDITSLAYPLHAAGSEHPYPHVDGGVELLTLTLAGVWEWPGGETDDEALVKISDGIRHALEEVLNPLR